MAEITGTEGADVLVGTSGDDVISGLGGDDVLFGGIGADLLIGGAGNDQLWVDNANDVVDERAGGGRDVIYSTISYVLAPGQEIEILSTASNAGTDAIDLTGNEFANTLYGNNGANTLNGGGGSGDLLVGLGGDDVYWIIGDERVFEAQGGGRDVIYTNVHYVLLQGQEVEILSTSSNAGTKAIDLTGNEFANTIYGNNGSNRINGGLGSDTLIGFGGADFFFFDTTLGSGNVDVVVDFVSRTDKINLDDAIFVGLRPGPEGLGGAFVIGTAAADADDRIIYDPTSGALYYDADGVGSAAAVHFATLLGAPSLTGSDFFVV
ncbi:MAG: hypothetical protein K2Y20_15650 [Sphingomonas sp.]|nr:hypothetical protein [Sphingomonas sp.]